MWYTSIVQQQSRLFKYNSQSSTYHHVAKVDVPHRVQRFCEIGRLPYGFPLLLSPNNTACYRPGATLFGGRLRRAHENSGKNSGAPGVTRVRLPRWVVSTDFTQRCRQTVSSGTGKSCYSNLVALMMGAERSKRE